MKTETACLGCSRTLLLDARFAGRRVRCPHCGTIYIASGPGNCDPPGASADEHEREEEASTDEGIQLGPLRTVIPRARRIRRLVITVLAVLAACCIVGPLALRFHQVLLHQRAHRAVQTAITRLALHRPEKMSDGQWAFCIHWTWNLHGNYGAMYFAPTDGLQELARELNGRIDRGPDRATIDWVWDRYMSIYPPAESYEKFRPTSPRNREAFLRATEVFGSESLSCWRSEYQQLAGTSPEVR